MDNKKRGAFDSEEDDGQNLDKFKKNKSNTPCLDNFGKDLTRLAAQGKLDSVIGREEEIDQAIQILNKRKKRNPILVGENGVGKCICSDTLVTLRNDITGEVIKISIVGFVNALADSKKANY